MFVFDLLTVDVWDTLIRRACHPDEVKLATARYLARRIGVADAWSLMAERCRIEGVLADERRRAGKDEEYTFDEVMRRVIAGLRPEIAAMEREALLSSCCEAEIAHERRVMILDPDILAAISAIPHRKSAFLSDFYHPAEVIRGHLAHLGVLDRFTHGYVSCDHGINKRSGALYRMVQQKLGVSPERHAHLGDNLEADVLAARREGVHAIHFTGGALSDRRTAQERHWLQRRQRKEGWIKDLPIMVRPTGAAERLADDLALVVGHLVLHAAERAMVAGIRDIYFFTREGVFFLKAFQAFQRAGVIPKELTGHLLEVSRVATFGPSLAGLEPQILMRLWNQYSTQSMAAFLRSLGEEPELFADDCRRHRLLPEEMVTYPWQDARVLAWLSDPMVRVRLESGLAERRTRLLGYLKRHDFPMSGTAMVVDIGWRGTIQDNLCHLLPEVTIHGCYLGLQPFLNDQPTNAVKSASGPDLNGKIVSTSDQVSMLFISPVEMLTNAPTGSIVGYGPGPGFVALARADPGEDRIYERFTAAIQAATLERCVRLGEVWACHAVAAEDLRSTANARLHELVTNPSRLLADAYFELQHNEIFGTGSVARRDRRIPVGLFAGAALSNQGRKRLWHHLLGTSWPQGYLVQAGLGILLARLNRELNKRHPPRHPVLAVDDPVAVIAAQQVLIEERWVSMQSMEAMIRERDATIASQKALIEERWAAMQSMERMIRERDDTIASLRKER